MILFARGSARQVVRGQKKKKSALQRPSTTNLPTQRRQSSRLSTLAKVNMAESGEQGSESAYSTDDEYVAEHEAVNSSKVILLVFIKVE